MDVDTLPETRLTAAQQAALPAASAPAPWTCRARAVVWLQRGRTVGAFIEYAETPVGPYREVLAARLLAPLRVTVPLIAVDSLASVHGGRANWSLPKGLVRIAGDVTTSTCAEGDGWSVTAAVRSGGPRLPVRATFALDQAGRVATVRATGRARPALVRVRADGPTVGGWLTPGPHPGAVVDATFTIGPATAG